ncbi:MAG: polysaccharide deacetylase [Lachnospiraceae bacterium]|nr:polysaccharide deacetylase [Lachnospiraceae bacterium]
MPEKYEIMVIKKRVHWKHIFLVIGICLILVSMVLGVVKARKDNENALAKIKQEQEQKIAEEKRKEEEELEREKNTIQVKIAKYTEAGANNIKNIYTSDYKRVFMTFDDGPSANNTPQILDILAKNDIKASFFVLGSRVEQNPSVVKRAFKEGHFIANHGYSHVYNNIYATYENLLYEYNITESIVRNAINEPSYKSVIFRFPGGSSGGIYNSQKKLYKNDLLVQEIMYVDWNSLSQDSTGKYTIEEMMQNIINTSNGKNSVVLLLHDAADKELTVQMLQQIIDYFKNDGYVFQNFYDVLDYDLVDVTREK